jgi:LacI family transcriptional regulator, gluconate utilization system Gnt-I transcriptional repressor
VSLFLKPLPLSPYKEPRKKRRSSGAITLKDVASLAGVAQITASRAINNPHLVSPEVLKKVHDAVEKTGYVQNKIAGSLASVKSGLIAALIPNFSSSIFLDTIDTLNQTLFEAGYQLLLGQTNYSIEREKALLDQIIGQRPDGIFITGVVSSELARQQLLASHIPVVEAWDLTPDPIDMLVGFSHEKIGTSVAQYLIQKGYRHLAIIGADDERALRRLRAYAQEVDRHAQRTLQGAEPGAAQSIPASKSVETIEKVKSINVHSSRTVSRGREALMELLALDPRTDAVFCSSDLLALGVVTQAQHLGIPVPEQLAVMGFGDIPFAKDTLPALSSVKINSAEIGRLSAHCLIERANSRQIEPNVMDLGFEIIERDTT